MLKQLLLGSLLGSLFLAMPLAVRSQTSPPASAPPQQETPQKEVSQQELRQFANIIRQVRVINQQAQQDMVQAVESEGLSLQRFIEIERAAQNSNAQSTTQISADEKQKFEKALTKARQIRQQLQAQVQQVVQQSGLKVERLNQIIETVKQSPALQQQVQQMMQNNN